MLSYRHAYHAGNFADVFKHCMLTSLLGAFPPNEPIFYADTHAGAGRYDLDSPMACQNAEYGSGIGKLWLAGDAPAPVAAYLACVAALNPGAQRGQKAPRWYPGSPWIAAHLLGARTRLLFCELHPADAGLLRENFAGDTRVAVAHEDGYRMLQRRLPPPQAQGLVLLDPAYERRGEIERLGSALIDAHRRWPTGVLAAWYPIMPKVAVAPLFQRLRTEKLASAWVSELCVYPDDNPLGLNGSGMVIINAPETFANGHKTWLRWLWKALAVREMGRIGCGWLKDG
ncbi:MAG: 23S rRNA (adenine(2030)-N(6))-methyltransferase RlmJ [Gammaproteobacteria bacterium]